MIAAASLRRLASLAEQDGVRTLIVGMVVERDGKALLLRRKPDDFMGGVWELPSGKVETEEALEAAVRRELREETGLTLAAIREFIGCFDYLGSTGGKSRQLNFAVDVTAYEPVDLQEHDCYRWAHLSGDLPVTDLVKDVLVRYRRRLHVNWND